MDREVWSSFTHDPRDAQYHAIRASDQDRASVQQALSEAYAEGRLDREEFDQRSEAAGAVRTMGEIQALLRDLVPATGVATTRSSLAVATPGELHQRALQKYASDRREAVFGFLFATLVCSVIWLLTSGVGSFPWPAFVALGTGINVVRTLSRKQEIVADHERRLERKRAKELGKPRPGDDKAPE